VAEKRLRVPNEDVRLREAEIAVTQTRTFQRLFFLKQLGLAYLVYPAASHTRGAHSIECLNQAVKILAALPREAKPSTEEEDAVRMAALLHDIGHVPFSHTLEDEHAILPKHDRGDRFSKVLDRLHEELGSEAAKRAVDAARPILNALCEIPGFTQDWKSDLIGGTVCADLLAYITTDAAWTGIEKRPGYYRIYDYFEIRDERLCIRLTKGGLRNYIVSSVMDLLDMRYALTERVFFHHAKCVASAMLARAAMLCKLEDKDELTTFGDERFLDYLGALGAKNKGGEHLIDCLRSRRLYKRIFKIGREAREGWDFGRGEGDFCSEWRNPDKVGDRLRSIEHMHKLPLGTLVLWCPDWRKMRKLVDAHVVWHSAGTLDGPHPLRSDELRQQFPGVAKRVANAEDQYLDLWTFWIAMDRDHLEKAARVVQSIEDELGIPCDPVFHSTYLIEIPGFGTGHKAQQAVRKTLEKLGPRVMANLDQQAALDGQEHLDETTILSATESAAHEQMASEQTTLFDDDISKPDGKK
jgi:hypothetical protein